MPRLAVTGHASPYLPSKESSRGARRLPCCRLQLLTDLARPDQATPYLSRNCPASSTLLREQQRGLAPSVLPSAAIAQPSPASPRLATPRQAILGLTPKDAHQDQATSASLRLRLSVTGITSVSNRPCLGLQSPKPTSLPASLAISATSPRFITSGSY